MTTSKVKLLVTTAKEQMTTCDVVFAPTRTNIVGVAAVEPANIRVDQPEDFRTRFRWSESQQVQAITFEVEYTNEPPNVLIASWNQKWRTEGEPVSTMDFKAIYDFRDKLGRTGEQRFLFELDRQTSQHLMCFAPDIAPEVRAQRQVMLDRLNQNHLGPRLYARWRDGSVRNMPVDADLLIYFSAIVHKAAMTMGVGEDWSRVGLTIERFAAGDMIQHIPVQRFGCAYDLDMVQPDSYFLFYFAEFALAALDENACAQWTDMWTGLMPSLVKAQAYYMARFSDASCLTQHFKAMALLSEVNRVAIDARFPPRGSTRATLEAAMYDNLKLLPNGMTRCY